jgi:hypothetical protein
MNELEPKVYAALNEHNAIENEKHKYHAMIAENKNKIVHNKILQLNEDFYLKHLANITKLTDIYKEETEKYILYQRLQIKFNRHRNIYHDNNGSVKEKKEFIMKCVKEDCRGFLSQAYKCDLCSTYVCKDCMVIKIEKNDITHVCKKEYVDTVSMIRKETRPCPKCGIRISKIDGCDQMWCTADGCGTAFSWISGKIINGTIHNPHYYEWVRRNNNGVVPRNPGDIPCGGFPDFNTFSNSLRSLGINIYTINATPQYTNPFKEQVTRMYNIHRCFIDIQEYRLALYTPTQNAMIFKEYHVDFLLGNITEEKWIQSIFMKELNAEKRQAILIVLQTFLAAGQDLFRGFIPILNELVYKKAQNTKFVLTPDDFKPIDAILVQFETLRSYINENLVTTGESVSTPVPQFDTLWTWQSVTSVEKIKASKETEKK